MEKENLGQGNRDAPPNSKIGGPFHGQGGGTNFFLQAGRVSTAQAAGCEVVFDRLYGYVYRDKSTRVYPVSSYVSEFGTCMCTY